MVVVVLFCVCFVVSSSVSHFLSFLFSDACFFVSFSFFVLFLSCFD